MEKSELRRLVFEVLRRDPQTHLNAVEFQVRSIAEAYERHDALCLHEVVWELLLQGVLAPGKNSLNLNLPFLHITDYGAQCLESGEIILHDPDGYMHALEEAVGPPLDPTIRTYVHSAQEAFLTGNYLATLNLLASAVERCANLLESVIAVNTADALQSATATLERIIARISSLEIADDQREEIVLQLDVLRTVVEHTRDRHGQPRAVAIDRETAYGSLLLFPNGLRVVYRLLSEIKGRSRP